MTPQVALGRRGELHAARHQRADVAGEDVRHTTQYKSEASARSSAAGAGGGQVFLPNRGRADHIRGCCRA